MLPGVLHNRGDPAPYGFQSTHHCHQRGLLLGKETSRPDVQAIAVRESEVLVETTSEGRREMGMTVNEAREDGLPSSVVDLGLGIRFKDGVGRADRHDLVAFDRERHVVLNGIGVHDGCMREDDGPARRRLSLEAALLEKEGCGAGADAGEQLAPGEVHRAARGLRRRRRATNTGVCHKARNIVDARVASQQNRSPDPGRQESRRSVASVIRSVRSHLFGRPCWLAMVCTHPPDRSHSGGDKSGPLRHSACMAKYRDQVYNLVDCLSFVVMKRLNITEALTLDDFTHRFVACPGPS